MPKRSSKKDGEARKSTPPEWGQRFRDLARSKELSLATIAERLDKSESGVRSWLNGTREPNIGEFLLLCKAADIDAAVVLFSGTNDAKFLVVADAWAKANKEQKNVLCTAAKGILAEHESEQQRAATRRPSSTLRG